MAAELMALFCDVCLSHGDIKYPVLLKIHISEETGPCLSPHHFITTEIMSGILRCLLSLRLNNRNSLCMFLIESNIICFKNRENPFQGQNHPLTPGSNMLFLFFHQPSCSNYTKMTCQCCLSKSLHFPFLSCQPVCQDLIFVFL